MKLMNLPKFINSAWDALFQGGWDEMPGFFWYLILSTHIGKGTQRIRNLEPVWWLAQEWAQNLIDRSACPITSFRNLLTFCEEVNVGWRNQVLKDTQEEWLPYCQETLSVGSSYVGCHSLPPRHEGKRCQRSSLKLCLGDPPLPTMSFQTYASEPQGG